MTTRGALASALALVLLGGAATAVAVPVDEEQVHWIATQLRCVVCQNLSVADSPSEMARQMRVVIRERLASGDSPDQVVEYFVEKYGEWVLLSPRPEGFNLVVWVLPFAALFAGLGTILLVVVRWSRRAVEASPTLAPGDRERVRAELDRFGE